ncbi:MAG: arsenate reductase [Sphingobacteriales bacterium]|jgi:arsenate reductase
MIKKVYYLKTCSTCIRIMNEVNVDDSFELQNIKEEPITEAQLENLKKHTGSYESLFSRKAMKFKAMKLSEKTLTESDYKELILKEYTFLKRPVFIVSNEVFVGNNKKTLVELTGYLELF